MASSSSFSVAVAAALLLCILAAHGTGCHAKRSSKTHHAHAPKHARPHVQAPPPATSPPPCAPAPPPAPVVTNPPPYVAPNPPAGVTPSPAANSSAGPDDDGGACGFKNVSLPPFSAMTSCGNEPLFKDGKGCGSCYQVRPTINRSMHSSITTCQLSKFAAVIHVLPC
jgi:hypothetical protein